MVVGDFVQKFEDLTNTIISSENKLKPSFPIIKDNKTKDRAGVGAPPPPNFGRSINPNLIFFFLHPIGYLKINKN